MMKLKLVKFFFGSVLLFLILFNIHAFKDKNVAVYKMGQNSRLQFTPQGFGLIINGESAQYIFEQLIRQDTKAIVYSYNQNTTYQNTEHQFYPSLKCYKIYHTDTENSQFSCYVPLHFYIFESKGNNNFYMREDSVIIRHTQSGVVNFNIRGDAALFLHGLKNNGTQFLLDWERKTKPEDEAMISNFNCILDAANSADGENDEFDALCSFDLNARLARLF